MTRITFGLKEPATVSLRVYDAAGRLLRVLVAGSRPAGTYSELWDGRDASGRAVASGIYFYRLSAGAFESTKKMILVR
jgi:flagellar hook assembly protein FlgD